MYSSLDRVDLVLDDDQTTVHGQTDHRDADEIEATPELSVLFAVARVVNARRAGKGQAKRLRVAYVARCEPPAFLRKVLAVLGAELFVDQEPRSLDKAKGSIEPVLNQQLEALAERVRSERGLAFDVPSLEKLAYEARDIPSADEDEGRYWSTVFELGAFAGRVISSLTPSRWKVDERSGVVPFVLALEPADGPLKLEPMQVATAALAGSARELPMLVASVRERLAGLH